MVDEIARLYFVWMCVYIFLCTCVKMCVYMIRFLILYVLVFFAEVSFSGKGLRVGNSSYCLFEPNISS